MFFSKSFGYALRGILYIAITEDVKKRVRLGEMAATLGVPRYFLGKIMNRLANEGLVDSEKGHHGGFRLNKATMKLSLMELAMITGEMDEFETCVLRFRACNSHHPCPLHEQFEPMRDQFRKMMAATSIHGLLNNEVPPMIRNLRTGLTPAKKDRSTGA